MADLDPRPRRMIAWGPGPLAVALVGALAAGLILWRSGLDLRSLVAAVFALAAGLIALRAMPRRTPRALLRAEARLRSRLREDAREEAERIAETSPPARFRDEFLSAVRHELRNPLNSILGFTDVLLREIDGPLNEAQEEDVRAIREAGQYLGELVEAVLAEWESDPQDESPRSPVPLEPLIQEAGRLLRGQIAGRSSLTLTVKADPRVCAPLADRRRLLQVLLNLGTNAVRATDRGEVTLEAAPHADGARLTVRDTGIGIPENEIPRLFEEFVQIGKPRRGGSGLGLALTRQLVEWHGGRIEVESDLGLGSAFHVILPCEPDR